MIALGCLVGFVAVVVLILKWIPTAHDSVPAAHQEEDAETSREAEVIGRGGGIAAWKIDFWWKKYRELEKSINPEDQALRERLYHWLMAQTERDISKDESEKPREPQIFNNGKEV